MGLNPYDTPRGRLHRLADMTRRQFILLMAVLASIAGSLFGGIKTLGFLFPNANLEEPLAFTADVDPEAITVGNPLQITEKRVSIIRDDGGYYAVYLICTHLGCTPNYVTNVTSGTGVTEDVAKSHGERKAAEATPNGWADVQFSPSGKLVVDRAKLVVQRGAGVTTKPEWRLDPKTRKDNGKTLP